MNEKYNIFLYGNRKLALVSSQAIGGDGRYTTGINNKCGRGHYSLCFRENWADISRTHLGITMVIDFVNRLEIDPSKYYFAVAVNAGQVAATLIQLQTLMQSRGLNLSSGFSLNLPSNYIPWGGADSAESQQKKFHYVADKITRIAATIQSKETNPLEKGPLWQNIILSLIYRQSYNAVHKMDKSFWADDKCNNCAICKKICPAKNILIENDKPVWQHRCDQCFACLQWCPEEAIQYGKNTSKKKRYRHPEVKLSEMLASIPAKK
jgi:ferredoxin